MDNVEFLILRNLLHNEEYVRKVIPFIKSDYFDNRSQKIVYEEILKFVEQYNKPVTKEILCIETEKRQDITDGDYKEITQLISSLEEAPTEFDWLVSTTEKWCRDRAIYLALMESIQIADGQDEKKNRDAIPTILSDALAVSFDTHVGHDYLQDYEARYESYHKKEDKTEFDLEYFNKITKGGLPNKTLNIALAGTGVGKSLFMCHVAASALLNGKNVLYITLEMIEEKIAERIDANLLNVPIQEISDLPKMMYESKVTKLSEKTQGTLIIKEYPTASAHAGHFRGLLNELAIKKSFRPDIIFIDYLNICASSRYRGNLSVNSYKHISKLLLKNLEDSLSKRTYLSYLPPRLPVLVTVGSDVELLILVSPLGCLLLLILCLPLFQLMSFEELGQIMVKQLKNRYNDPTVYKRFIVGIDRAKMRLYDCEQTAQTDMVDSGQEEEYTYEDKPKKSFDGFKF